MRLIDQEAYELAKLQRHEEQQFYRAHGRKPHSEQELHSWLFTRSSEEAAIREANERERRLREAEVQRGERQARLAIDGRLTTRTSEPPDYRPPQSVEELATLSAGQAAFAERSSLKGTKDSPARIETDLENFNLSNSQFEWVTFSSKCNLKRADFRNSKFLHVTFESNCVLNEANFDSATFQATTFDPAAQYDGARFRFADFLDSNLIEFDRNYLFNATFHRGRKDAWSRLSSAYAGIWQFINVALSAAFFGTLLMKLYTFEAIYRVQVLVLSYTPFSHMSTTNLQNISAGTFIFGDRLSSLLTFLLFIAYQVLRLFVTTRVGPMIEMEKQTGYTPSRTDYLHMRNLNYLVSGMGYIVIIILVWDILTILQLHILVPSIPAPRP